MNEPDKTPTLDTIRLRRYVTFSRFRETLEKGLFIPKASLFKDRWEAMVSFMHDHLKEQNLNVLIGTQDPTPDGLDIRATHRRICEGKKEVYVSCWNGTPHECVAMWKLYGRKKAGVLLETDAKELTEAFHQWPENKDLLACLTRLRYVLPGDTSYDKVFGGEEPLWDSGFHGEFSTHFCFHCTYTGLHYKHISYSFEKEYRLLVAHKARGERQNSGITLPVTKSFIKRVMLQPDSSRRLEQMVRHCLRKSHLDDVVVEKSLLDELPPLEE